MFPSSFLFIFHAGSRVLGSNNLRNSSYKEKTAGFRPYFQTIFPFLMTMVRVKYVICCFEKLSIYHGMTKLIASKSTRESFSIKDECTSDAYPGFPEMASLQAKSSVSLFFSRNICNSFVMSDLKSFCWWSLEL